jgi:protein associated with RNAse G/E
MLNSTMTNVFYENALPFNVFAELSTRLQSVLNLVSPFCMFENENSFYDFDYQLMIDVSILHGEILSYLDGKHAPSKQLELELT